MKLRCKSITFALFSRKKYNPRENFLWLAVVLVTTNITSVFFNSIPPKIENSGYVTWNIIYCGAGVDVKDNSAPRISESQDLLSQCIAMMIDYNDENPDVTIFLQFDSQGHKMPGGENFVESDSVTFTRVTRKHAGIYKSDNHHLHNYRHHHHRDEEACRHPQVR